MRYSPFICFTRSSESDRISSSFAPSEAAFSSPASRA
ncbi:hypothetical protein X793_01475 [Dehalococcoides mccartyi CG4]|nr:hypothetical protein X793_01475 [Dehalococcoides mccartyi CG4]